jgi:hypothetical protein
MNDDPPYAPAPPRSRALELGAMPAVAIVSLGLAPVANGVWRPRAGTGAMTHVASSLMSRD